MLPLPVSVAQNAIGKVQLDTNSFIYFSLHSDSKLLSTQHQIAALALSIIMGVLTLGIGHLICKIICEIKKHQVNALAEKIIKIAQKELGCTQELLKDAAGVYISLGMAQKEKQLTEEEINDLLNENELSTLQQLETFMNHLSPMKQSHLKSQVSSLIPQGEEMIDLITLPILETMDQHLRNT